MNVKVDSAWFPLSPAQRSRWFMYQWAPERRAQHNNIFAVRLRGVVCETRMAGALQALAERNPMLRARIVERDGEPMQCTDHVAQVPLRRTSARQWDDGRLRAAVLAETLTPFGPEQPLVRGHLFDYRDDEAVFVLSMDHLISDGWSYWRLLAELGQLLRGRCMADDGGDGATYRDYVQWQRGWMNSPEAARQRDYWLERLAGDLPELRLGFAEHTHPEQAQQGSIRIDVSAGQLGALRALASRQAANLFTVILSAFQIVLQRYTAQEDLIVGCPMPARGDGRWDAVVGDFVNMVPLRTRVGAEDTLAEVMRKSRNDALAGLARQEYPFQALIEALRLSRAATHPVFQVMFAFQKARYDEGLSRLWSFDDGERAGLQWGDLSLAAYHLEQPLGLEGIALSLQVLEAGETLRCEFSFDHVRLEREAIERLAASFVLVMDAMASSDPATRVADLPIVPEHARTRMLQDFNDTGLVRDEGMLLHGYFEAQVRRNGDAVALEFEDCQLSYFELNCRANRLAHRLIAQGVGPDDRVAVCLRRGVDMVVALLAVLKAGGAYVPLDPGYPAERLAFMLADSAPRCVLAQTTLREVVPASDAAVLWLDEEALQQQPDHDPDTAALGLRPQHLAYVIYTSGSTGKPKGVMIGHGNAANFIAWSLHEFEPQVLSRVVFSTSINFDLHVFELFAPLAAGTTTVLVPDLISAGAVLNTATLVNTVPSAIAAVLDSGATLHGVRQVNLAGEPLKAALVGRLFERTAIDTVSNLYGPSETTTYSTWVSMPRAGGFIAHIGRPIGNTQVYIVDSRLQPVPAGVTGEILIGGAGVARGYLGREELTAERFIAVPFASGGKVYRTGDLGRWRADGSIEYLGRNDFQVKLRGFRIELGEIEAVLADCAGVREAVVVVRADAGGEQRLVAYYVADADAAPTAQVLRQQVARTLAPYMVPSAFVCLPAMPLTPNGKLDRQALPIPGLDASVTRGYAAPEAGMEQVLAAIWAELLGVERVGRHDDFFELGGHSLLAVQLAARLRATAGVQATVRDVFALPVLEDLAAALGPIGTEDDPLDLADRQTALLPSLAQQRLWFLAQLDPRAGAAYHMPAAVTLTGALDRIALRHALDAIVARHEVLRTSFAVVEGSPVQVIAAADVGIALVEHDLRALGAGARALEAERWSAHEAHAAFDLSTGPLIRARLLILDDQKQILLVTQHHIVSDGWSIGVLVRELTTLYAGFLEGVGDTLPPLTVQYADYARWERGRMNGEKLETQVGFWRSQLRGAPALLELPTDRPRPSVQSHAGASVSIVLPSVLTKALRDLSRRHGTTVFMTLLAGWSILMARLSGQEDVVVGTPVANRMRQEFEPMVGLFVNTLPMRVRVDPGQTVSQLLAQVKTTALDAFAHQALPFDQIVDAAMPPRSLAHNAVFQTMLTLDTTPATTLALPGLSLQLGAVARSSTQFDLALSLREGNDVLEGLLEYATDLFDQATVQRWAEHLQILWSAMAEDAASSVAALPMQPEHARTRMLQDFNDTGLVRDEGMLLHGYFEAQVRRNGDAVALEFEDCQLSYSELNCRANRLAHRLIAQGVGPDDRVAVCLRRGVDMVVALLAVLKAGGAYVPLDPGYPAERLAFMLADSAPRCVLAQTTLREVVPASDAAVLWLDEEALQQQPDHDPDTAALGLRPQHLAYVIYTSGSTGKPKGVMIGHGNAANFIAWSLHEFEPQVLSRVVFSTSINFDLHVFELFAPLAAGTTTVLVPDLISAGAVLNTATLVNTVPSAIAAVLDSGATLHGVRQVNLAGEPLKAALVGRLFERTAIDTVSNLYGPSETTTYSTWVSMPRAGGFIAHIGRPIGNTQVYIVDSRLQPVPAGVTGEILIGGAGVARGYLGREELTAERFIAVPFASGGKVYRTGDLGRWRADGSIEYLGRNDFQVKLRGFRIELGEIEAVLADCAGVREAVVVVRADAGGEQRLVAYYVADADAAPTAQVLRQQVARTLAPYMVPSAFVCLPAMPLTPNGKLDRQALPIPGLDASVTRGYAAPEAGMEQALAAIWAELLGVERVGRHDDFFELGGNSLQLIRLGFHLKERFSAELKTGTLYEAASLSQMAVVVEAASRRRQSNPDTTITLEI